MRFAPVLLVGMAIASAACHPGPILAQDLKVGGTIAGIVKTSDASVSMPGRRISVVDVATGERRDTTTGADGGYTIQVPKGKYRIDLELRGGETLARRPEPTQINNGDIDGSRDFVIIVRAGGGD